jgi:hypothetical protein
MRPLLTMTTKTAEVEHQCIGDLFEGIDVSIAKPEDAIKFREVKIKY